MLELSGRLGANYMSNHAKQQFLYVKVLELLSGQGGNYMSKYAKQKFVYVKAFRSASNHIRNLDFSTQVYQKSDTEWPIIKLKKLNWKCKRRNCFQQ